jgi:hypothetical protein
MHRPNSGKGRTSLSRGERGKVRNRRISSATVRPDEGPLTERTAAVQPARREQVFMPHFCRWPWPAESLVRSTQTNEPGRCAVLLPLLASVPP